MTDITYIVANAKTWVKVPLMAFLDRAEALEYLRGLDLIGVPVGRGEVEFSYVKIGDNEHRLYEVLGTVVDLTDAVETTEVNRVGLRLVEALFLNGHYYDGAGRVGSLSVVTLPAGKPVVEFDLG